MLNSSANDILRSINESVPVSPGYLLTVLQAYNAIDNATGPGNPTSDATSAGTGNNPPNTALAMFVDFVILISVPHLISTNVIQDHPLRHYWLRFNFVLHCHYIRCKLSYQSTARICFNYDV